MNCESLQYVDINNASAIYQQAFKNCINLSKIRANNLYIVGTMAFDNCINLESITLSPSYSTSSAYTFSLGDYAFNNCKKLSAVYLETSRVYSFNENAFAETPILDSSYLGYYGSIYVHPDVLSSYISLYSSTRLANRFASFSEDYLRDHILAHQFYNQYSSLHEIPESLANAKTVGAYAFYQCSSLYSVYLSQVKEVGHSAFYVYRLSGSTLRNVQLPECEYVGISAFANYSSYTTLNLSLSKCKIMESGAARTVYSYGTYLNLYAPELEYIGEYATNY